MVLAREEHQQDHREHIRQHEEEVRVVARQPHREAQLVAAGTGQTKDQAHHGSGRNVPVAKDHCGDGQVAKAHVDAGREVRRDGVGIADATNAAERTGDDHGDEASLVNVAARGVNSLGVLAARAQAHAKARLVHEVPGGDRNHGNEPLVGVHVSEEPAQHGNLTQDGHGNLR